MTIFMSKMIYNYTYFENGWTKNGVFVVELFYEIVQIHRAYKVCSWAVVS